MKKSIILLLFSLILVVVIVALLFLTLKKQHPTTPVTNFIEEVNKEETQHTQINNNVKEIPSREYKDIGGVTINGEHIRGNINAPITIIEYGDFGSFSSRLSITLNTLLMEYENEVRLIYRHYLVTTDGQKVAEASECAAEHGKFWEFYDLMYKNYNVKDSSADTDTKLKEFAATLGLVEEQSFNNCVSTRKYKSKINIDLPEGILGSPASYINDQVIYGAQSIEVFREAIDAELN